MSTGCPSDLALEAHLLEPARSAVADHVARCPSCAARLARMQAEGEEFRRFVFPATVDAVEDASAGRRRRPLFLLAPVGALVATAAALFLVFRPSGPGHDYLGVKGDPLHLAVYVGAEGGARVVEDGAPVPATAALRFAVRTAAAGCYLWILSVDSAGAVSRVYPPKGAAQDRRGPGEVPGGAVLDGQPGPERIYAVCAPEPIPWNDVKQAAAASASGGAERVRAARNIAGLPGAVTQASLLVEKRP